MARAALVALLAIIASCSPEAPARTSPPRARGVRSVPAEPARPALERSRPPVECPSYSAGARVAAQPTEGGAALVFVTTPGDTVALRKRVASLRLPPGVGSAGLRTDNIGNGVRLVFEPDSQAHVRPLRQAVEGYAKDLAMRCGLTLAPPAAPAPRPTETASDPTTGAPAPKPDASAAPPSPPVDDSGKPAKPDGAEKEKPAPTPAPSDEVPGPPPRGSASALPDPFKPPPPNLPSPPQNPF